MKRPSLSIVVIISLILVQYSIISFAKDYEKTIIIIKMENTIDLGMEDLLSRAINTASPNTKAIVIILNTNGGYLEATEGIVDLIMRSTIKVIVYIPAGGRAFSAGAYIALASDRLIMAPGSVIGSAEPRSIGGMEEDPKIINAMASWIESIALSRDRNATAARYMVTENRDYTAMEAVKYGIAEYIEADFHRMLVKEGLGYAYINSISPDIRSRFISVLCDPFILGLLLELAALLILIEVFHPTYLGGFAGGAAFVLALLGLGMIGADATAIILLLLGISAILLEVKLGHGGSAVAGAILIIFGTLLLYRREYFIWTISYTSLLVGGIAILIIVSGVAGFYLHKIREVIKRRRSPLDLNMLIGKVGVVKSRIEPGKPGVVLAMSDYWTAYSDEVIEEGEKVKILRVDGLKVYVRRIEKK